MATNFPTSVDVLTNPVSNDSLNSPSHSAQHANANDAIEAVEDYLLNGAGKTGLVFITSADLSSTSVTISNAFSATYDSYQIVLSNVLATAGQNTQMRMGTTATGYYQTEIVSGGSYSTASGGANYTNTNNGTQWSTGVICGTTTTDTSGGVINLVNPFLATGTVMQSLGVDTRTTGLGTRTSTGYHASPTSFTSFTIIAGGGTFSAGKVRVYGYRNS
jgi:hypothetical protein